MVSRPTFADGVRRRYALIVAGLIFLCLLTSAGLRSTPGVLLSPIQKDLGWNAGSISLAAAIGIFLYGLTGPFAAAVMQRFGIRPTLVAALVAMAGAMALSTLVSSPWQLILTWGVMGGLATGCVASVLAATVVNRWFVKRRGLVMGVLTASASTGQLVFLPALAFVSGHSGWRSAVWIVAGAALAMAPIVFFLLPERPSSVGLLAYGADSSRSTEPPADLGNPLATALSALAWPLAAPIFGCCSPPSSSAASPPTAWWGSI